MNGITDAPVTRRPRRLSRLFTLALFVLGLGFVIYTLAPQTLGETARRQLLSQLQSHYRGHSVSIRRGHFDPKVGFIFEDLRISDISPSTYRYRSREMVRIERLTVLADIEPEKLLDQQNPLKTRRIIMDGVHANVWLNAEGKPALLDLLPFPKLGPAAPRMELRRVHVHLVNGESRSRPVTAEFDEIVIVNLPTIDGGVDKRITCRGSTDFADELVIQVGLRAGATDVRGSMKRAYLSRDLFDRLPDRWAEQAKHVRELQSVCDASFAFHQTADGKLDYKLRTTVHDGRFHHPSLPKPITKLRGVVVCDPGGVSIEASQATFGDAIVRLSGRLDGHRWPCVANLNVSTRGLLLDDRISASLPPSMQTGWARLQPLGRINADATLRYVNGKWKTDASVICKGVNVRYEKFPYPVENLVGQIEIHDGIATSDSLSGRVGGNRMKCAFRLPVRPGITNEKTFVVATDGPVPIDNILLNALSPRGSPTSKLESFVRTLHPGGSIQLATALITSDANGKLTRKVDIRVIDGRLRYEKFAYPLYNVGGKIQIENDLVTLVDLRAINANGGTVLCDGTYRMPPSRSPPSQPIRISDATLSAENSSHLAMSFHSTNIPMDEALRSSLPLSSRHVWDAIAPSGVLDELTVSLEQHGSSEPLQLDVLARQHDQQQVTSRTLSLRPTSLPYRIDVTGGTVRYDGNQVTIESLNGRHDGSTVSADGRCVRDVNGRWELLLNLHSGSRLLPDAELIAALPNQMREAMHVLQLRGPISVRGKTRFTIPDAIHPDPAIQWDLVLQLEGNRIADVGPVHSLRGEISVKGTRNQVGIRALGEVRIDSMHVYDLQITSIRGPFSIDGDMLRLGELATTGDSAYRSAGNEGPNSESIRGRLFDGTLDIDGEVLLSSGNFNVGLTMGNAQVPTILADFGHSDNEMTGTCSGQTQLQGNLGRIDLLKGSGAAQVADANLYKLPLIVQLMNLLRVTPAEDVAFTDGEVEFTLYGETMTFNDLQIWGDLVALHGGGTLDHRRELDLTFNTRVSPQNSFRQLVRPLGQRYTLGTIDVRGPLHALEIERRPLDGVGQTFERLFPSMADNSDDDAGESQGGFGRWLKR